MQRIVRTILIVAALIGGAILAMPADAQISAPLAKKCRALMVKAHPVQVFGETGSQAAQRAYFRKCISEQGNMPEAAKADDAKPSQPGTTGKGN